MSERERWVVYPLLFFALGASLRDKIFAITTSKSIVCQELTVVGENPPVVLAKIGRTDSSATGAAPSGYLYLHGDMEVHRNIQTMNLLAQGTVNANNYAYRGVRYAPVVRGVLPGISPAELLRALQESARAWSETQPSGAQPPGDAPATDDSTATDASPADESASPPAETTSSGDEAGPGAPSPDPSAGGDAAEDTVAPGAPSQPGASEGASNAPTPPAESGAPDDAREAAQ